MVILKDELKETPPDDMNVELWDTLMKIEKLLWRAYWLKKGVTYHRCKVCKYPGSMGVNGCAYCKYRKERGIPLRLAQ